MPDVAKVHYDQASKNVILTRVSGNAPSSFMDKLTVQKYGKNYKGPKLKVGSNNVPIVIGQKPVLRPLQFNYIPNFRTNVTYGNIPQLKPMNARLSANAVPFRSLPQAVVAPIVSSRSTRFSVAPRLNMQQRNVNVNNIPKPISSSLPSTSRNSTQNKNPFIPPAPSQTSLRSNSQTSLKFSQSNMSKKQLLKNLPPLRKFETVRVYKPEDSPPREANESESSITITSTSSTTTLVSNSNDNKQDSDNSDAVSTTSTEYMSVKSMPVLENSESSSTLVDSSENLKKSEPIKREAPVELKHRISSLRKLSMAIKGVKQKDLEEIKSPSALKFSFEIPNYKHGEKAFFKIKILDVDSPDCFTFQFSLEKLEVLMEKLNRHYDGLKNLEDYVVENIKIGMMVAVRNTNDNNRWYRAEIKEANTEKLGVRFIDYLTVNKQVYKVLATEVYNLEHEFAKESSKSAYGRLHGLKPKQNVWCQNSKIELELIRNGNMNTENDGMMATIKKIQNGVFSLSIILNQVDFIRISDYMVEQGYALVDFEDYLHLASKNQRSLVSIKIIIIFFFNNNYLFIDLTTIHCHVI